MASAKPASMLSCRVTSSAMAWALRPQLAGGKGFCAAARLMSAIATVCAFGQIGAGEGQADAARRAGDQRGLSLQVS
jgi:hypothetical protein